MPQVIPQTVKAEHVLEAAITFVHPKNGNRYYGVCEKQGGTDQNFVVYRRRPGQIDFEFVYQLDGAGRDAAAFVTMGGAVILQDGSLELWASGQPVGQLDTSGTGFDAIGAIVPNVDEPWTLPAQAALPSGPVSLRLRNPAGWRNYGGVGKQHQLSADGYIYWYACGWRNDVFGMYVMRQTVAGSEPAVFVDYPEPLMSGRGEMYLTGNGELYVSGHTSDKDITPRAEKVPGFKPLANVVTMIGGGASTGSSDPALAQKVAALEGQLAAANTAAKAALDRANYVKTIFDPVWGRLDALDKRPMGISRDDAWQLAADRIFGEVTTDTATRHAIEQLVQAAAAKIVVTTTDDEARRQAKAAQQTASEAYEMANSRPTATDVLSLARQAITGWLEESVAYTDKRLLNLIWDRGVKLARFLKVPGADKAPINDPKNISH